MGALKMIQCKIVIKHILVLIPNHLRNSDPHYRWQNERNNKTQKKLICQSKILQFKSLGPTHL